MNFSVEHKKNNNKHNEAEQNNEKNLEQKSLKPSLDHSEAKWSQYGRNRFRIESCRLK